MSLPPLSDSAQSADAPSAFHVSLMDVTKGYFAQGRRHTVFKNLTLRFRRGVNTGVIGPNGSGKSTLLRLIAGAEAPERGYVDRYSRMSWPLAFGGGFGRDLSGTANARFVARIYKCDPDYVENYTREFSGIGDFMDWPIGGYSSGMRSRFSFAISMAVDFDCILIDEVLGVGDAEFRAKCDAALEERRSRCDIILVTHNLKDVVRMCDEVVILGGPQPIVSRDVSGMVKRYNVALMGDAGAEI